MLNQAPKDREKLARLLNITEEESRFIENAEKGCGLIRCAADMLSFDNRWPQKGKIYNLITTQPKEGAFAEHASVPSGRERRRRRQSPRIPEQQSADPPVKREPKVTQVFMEEQDE